MTDKVLSSKYNFINRLSTYVMRQRNKATENGTAQRKGAWASHLFCTAAPEEQKPEGNSSSDSYEATHHKIRDRLMKIMYEISRDSEVCFRGGANKGQQKVL